MSTVPTWANLAHCCGRCQYWKAYADGAAFGHCGVNAVHVGQSIVQAIVTLDMNVCTKWSPVTDASAIISNAESKTDD